jgi:hypothetical protein
VDNICFSPFACELKYWARRKIVRRRSLFFIHRKNL